MAEEYARSIARVAAGQLAEVAGYEAVQESSVEILADLLLRYLGEVACGAASYAEMAGRSEANVSDVVLSLDNLGVTVCELAEYAESLDPDDNTFAHTLAPFPVRVPVRPTPTFEDRGEAPPPHVPSFLPAFPDAHTFEHTPSFAGHEAVPAKQTEAVQQQRRTAEKALVALHKRAKTEHDATAAATAAAAAATRPAGSAGAGSSGPDAAAASNPFLAPPCFEVATIRGGDASLVSVPEQVLLGAYPHHMVLDQGLVVRGVGPELAALMPTLEGCKLTDVFKMVHPAGAPLDYALLSSNPFQVYAFSRVAGRGGGGAGAAGAQQPLPALELQAQAVPARMRLGGAAAAATGTAPVPPAPGGSGGGTAKAAGGGAGGSRAQGQAQAAPGALAAPQPVLLLLARPRTLTDEELAAKDSEAAAAMASRRGAGPSGPAAASMSSMAPPVGAGGMELTALEPGAAEAAFRVLVGDDRDVAWHSSSAFEGGGGALKSTYDAGFSQDWTTKTKRTALGAASRLPQANAYAQRR
ncbi:hypothetical protein FOA52_000482 [Chlamydomonas sp. UWO 241]|nr:hypothetical protein FOA52_000482 [Chlamydomonas sp. UWO 241]